MRGRRRERLGSRVGTRYKPAIRRLRRTAVRWGPQFSSSAPPRSPAPSFDHFPFGQAAEALRVAHFKILLKNILLGRFVCRYAADR